jgi:hypothetical protein
MIQQIVYIYICWFYEISLNAESSLTYAENMCFHLVACEFLLITDE